MSQIRKRVDELKLQIEQIDANDLLTHTPDVLLDCREREEVELGVLKNSVWITKGQVELVFEEKFSDKNQRIVVYCASGFRSILVAQSLIDLGYKNIASLKGGIQAWKNQGLEISPFKSSGQINKRRFLSQLRVPEVGEEGQLRIQTSKVLIIGAGGLGSPVALYLAAAGVGTIGIIDADVVDESNLQRQILHSTDRIGLAKVQSAFLTLKSLNPQVQVNTYPYRLNGENVDQLFADYDLIIDGCDNFETRYLVNMACVKNKKINIHGSVLRFQGHVVVFGDKEGPCYSCVFPEPPSGELELDCSEGGVLGAAVGVIGTLMAVEALKYIIQKGRLLKSRMLTYDGFQGEFDELRLTQNKECKICGENTSEWNYRDLSKFLISCKGK